MGNSNFDQAFSYTLFNEGMEFTDRPTDSGGPTRYGITLKVYNYYMREQNDSTVLKNMTLDQAKSFYEQFFWNGLGLDKIISPYRAMAMFDVCVNLGPRYGIKFAQMAEGVSPPDGILGPISIQKINSGSISEFEFIYEFIINAMRRYVDIVTKNPNQIVNLAGWFNRAYSLKTILQK